jgi:fucose permease
VLIGATSGASGVLLTAQMRDYGVDRAVIGTTFFAVSAGFVLAGLSCGGLFRQLGVRMTLIVGGTVFTLAGLCLAARPPFSAFIALQFAIGYGTGLLESALSSHLATLPGATTLLNRMHGFWGVGALIGPVLAAWIITFAAWPMALFVLALAGAPLTAAFTVFPRRGPQGERTAPGPAPQGAEPGPGASGSLLACALRDRGILLGAAMLAIHDGLAIGVGSWAYSYLVQARALAGPLAGYSVSGYWLGLAAGRFVISPLAERAGMTTAGMMYGCLAGITAAATLAWLAPDAAAASAALFLLGFFLGPVFPTTVAITPRLTAPALVPTAIGVMNAGSVLGGSALPWLAGIIAQDTGIWTLLPFAVALALLQFATWRPLAARIRPTTADRLVPSP